MTIRAFTDLERKVLEHGLETNRKIDSLKAAVAYNVVDPREWDKVYMDTLVVLKALNVLCDYTQELYKLSSTPPIDKTFYWKVPMSPRYTVVDGESKHVPYCAFPSRFEQQLNLIWNRVRKDMKRIVKIINDTKYSESGLMILNMEEEGEHFYKMTWQSDFESMSNAMYLHKGKKLN